MSHRKRTYAVDEGLGVFGRATHAQTPPISPELRNSYICIDRYKSIEIIRMNTSEKLIISPHLPIQELIPTLAEFAMHERVTQRQGTAAAGYCRRDTEAVERILQVSIPPQWYEMQGLLRFRLQQLAEDPGYLPWSLRAISLRHQHLMVGYINCHTKPGDPYLLPFSPHGVEFGFEVFPPFRRQGYAREACLALMKWAYEEQHVPEFVVSIAPDNLPSRRLAEGLGFIQVGSHIDDIDGPEDVFRLRYPPSGAA